MTINKGSRYQTLFHIMSIILMVLVLSVFIVFIKALIDGEFNSVDSFQKYMAEYGVAGPVFLTFFQAFQVIVPVLPGFTGCAAGAVMFGPVVVFWCNYIGIGGGSIIAFLLAYGIVRIILCPLYIALPAGCPGLE